MLATQLRDSLILGIVTALSEEELGALQSYARGKIVLELGAEYGASTVALASTAARMCSVDWHQGDEQSGYKPSLGPFLYNLRRRGITVVSGHQDITDADHRRLMGDWWDEGRDEQTRTRGQADRRTVCVHVERFEDAVPRLGTLYDLGFLDGAHDVASVRRDIRLMGPKIKLGGQILCHDYGRFGVAAAINAVHEDGWTLEKLVGSLAVISR